MAERLIALLRGVNVGRAKRISMADVRGVFEGLGYLEVQTLLNSGNVVFTVPGKASRKGDPAARVEKAIASGLGVNTRVTVLTAEQLDIVLGENSLLESTGDPSRLLVAVPADASARESLITLARRDWSPEAMRVGTLAAYLWCPGGIHTSVLAKAVGRAAGDAVTARNWTTMTRLQALAAGRE